MKDGFTGYPLELVQSFSSQVLAASQPDRDPVACKLLIAYNQHIRYLLELCLSDFQVHPVGADIHMGTKPVGLELRGYLMGVVQMAFGYGDHHRLNRRQPDRESTPIVLDEATEETFHASENGSVYHYHRVCHSVNVHIGNIEPLRQVEIDLRGGTLPCPSQGISETDIDFGPIEYPFPRVYCIVQRQSFQCPL
jgi:hypothetical protein